ncbi:MAG TPA: DUF4156 domain-containing protein [Xanthomonadales bacterium]|nr:DUF4156 domain-containing protein [Xanthomonadales bacterium]
MSAPRLATLACAAAAALAGCTWVEPDARGLEVEVAGPGRNLSGCLRRGEVTVSVKHEVAGIARNEMKVRDELESLARNEAASLRASHVQALGDPRDGEQRFAAYDCVSPQ